MQIVQADGRGYQPVTIRWWIFNTIMTLNEQPEVRVVAATRETNEKIRAMVGKEYKVDTIFYYDKTLSVDGYIFNFSDVVWLTPLSFNGRRIAVGDEVKWKEGWYELQTFFNSHGKVRLVVQKGNKITWYLDPKDIVDHRTPQYTTVTELTLDDVAKKFGVDVKNLRIKE